MIFTNKNLANLFYFHFLNVYINTNNEEDFRKYINQIQNNLKIAIAFYIGTSQRVRQTKDLLIPLSIIYIFTEIYNQYIQLYGIRQVDISEIFQIISEDKNLHSDIVKNLEVLKELNIIYDFLEKKCYRGIFPSKRVPPFPVLEVVKK